jgi:hypothetical protein
VNRTANAKACIPGLKDTGCPAGESGPLTKIWLSAPTANSTDVLPPFS